MLLLVVALLAAKPNMVCSLKRMEIVVHSTAIKNQELKAGAQGEEAKNTIKNRSKAAKKVADPLQESKRRVRRGADPIHNKA